MSGRPPIHSPYPRRRHGLSADFLRSPSGDPDGRLRGGWLPGPAAGAISSTPTSSALQVLSKSAGVTPMTRQSSRLRTPASCARKRHSACRYGLILGPYLGDAGFAIGLRIPLRPCREKLETNSDPSQSLVEVLQEVWQVFHPDRDANQPVGDARLEADLPGHIDACGRRGVSHERADAAQAHT